MIELQAIIFQYLRAYEQTPGATLLKILQEALPEATREEIAHATLSLIERLYPEDRRLIAYLEAKRVPQ